MINFKLFITLLIGFFTSSSYAVNQGACSKMLNAGMFKTYEYGGIDQPLTKATKKHGMSKASSVTSTEGTTAISDPKYWSNITTSQTQSTSSWGDCSAIALHQLQKARNSYIAQNKDEIFNEVAQGNGKHINVLASMTLCEDSAYSTFKSKLQDKMSSLISYKGSNIGSIIDEVVDKDSKLNSVCHSWTKA